MFFRRWLGTVAGDVDAGAYDGPSSTALFDEHLPRDVMEGEAEPIFPLVVRLQDYFAPYGGVSGLPARSVVATLSASTGWSLHCGGQLFRS